MVWDGPLQAYLEESGITIDERINLLNTLITDAPPELDPVGDGSERLADGAITSYSPLPGRSGLAPYFARSLSSSGRHRAGRLDGSTHQSLDQALGQALGTECALQQTEQTAQVFGIEPVIAHQGEQ